MLITNTHTPRPTSLFGTPGTRVDDERQRSGRAKTSGRAARGKGGGLQRGVHDAAVVESGTPGVFITGMVRAAIQMARLRLGLRSRSRQEKKMKESGNGYPPTELTCAHHENGCFRCIQEVPEHASLPSDVWVIPTPAVNIRRRISMRFRDPDPCAEPIAPVAQLDRAPGFEPGSREFEPLRARHLLNSFCLSVL